MSAMNEAEAETPVEAAEKSKAKPARAKKKAEKKFPIANLAKNCRDLFGVSSCIFAGATVGLTGEYTVKEMKSIIDKWCGKEIM